MRGLSINKSKSKSFILRSGKPFDFLGFTFRYFIWGRKSRITSRTNKVGLKIDPRAGLFVYVSNKSILSFKNKLKSIFKYNRNSSLFQLITKLNPVLRG